MSQASASKAPLLSYPGQREAGFCLRTTGGSVAGSCCPPEFPVFLLHSDTILAQGKEERCSDGPGDTSCPLLSILLNVSR